MYFLKKIHAKVLVSGGVHLANACSRFSLGLAFSPRLIGPLGEFFYILDRCECGKIAEKTGEPR